MKSCGSTYARARAGKDVYFGTGAVARRLRIRRQNVAYLIRLRRWFRLDGPVEEWRRAREVMHAAGIRFAELDLARGEDVLFLAQARALRAVRKIRKQRVPKETAADAFARIGSLTDDAAKAAKGARVEARGR